MYLDNESDVADLLKEMNKKQVIENHPYKISEMQKHGEVYFLSYLYDETKKNNRRQITAKSRVDIENKIYNDYKKKEAKSITTFEDVYIQYLKTEKVLSVEPATLQRFNNDYIRFYRDTDFVKTDITKIKRIDVKTFYLQKINKFNLTSKSFANMRTITRQVFDYALELEMITVNPAIGIKLHSSVFAKTKKSAKTEVFDYLDKEALEKYIMTHEHKNSVPYGLVLNFQLGLRVGELVALKWDDINKNTIDISRMEITYRPLNLETMQKMPTVHKIVDHAKTDAGCRTILLTDKAKTVLEAIKAFNKEHNIKSEWIISNENGRRIYKETVNDTLYSYCDKAELLRRSNHKIRKTTLSAWLDAGMNTNKVCEMAGHEDIETTMKYYIRNRDNDDDILLKMSANL